MNRRAFLGFLAAAGAAFQKDPERALWVPGAKTISIPDRVRMPTPDEMWAIGADSYIKAIDEIIFKAYREAGGVRLRAPRVRPVVALAIDREAALKAADDLSVFIAMRTAQPRIVLP